MATLFALSLAALMAIMALLWLLSLPLRNASIVDIFWGVGFVVVAWLSYVYAGRNGATPSLLLPLMTTAWGLRLAGYLAWRNLGKGEDYRYRSMRKHIGPRFWWVSLFSVFALQGVLIGVVSLPIQAGLLAPAGDGVSWLCGAGIAAWLVGVGFETVGDLQLARFKADPANRGQVMDRGLWRYTRHPNYFGDFMVWWGLYLVAVSDIDRLLSIGWTAIGPAIMSVLLLRVSGVTLLEKTITDRRPGYADYIRRTSAFFPRPPKPAAGTRATDLG
ncbi:DUF1295 domain-containing protein [Haliangium sp.]|uniref:DUF1295 domain-containing protein n=1 Tax=Haliangium sp. TaxID=2663208 RepID=UPI003D11D9E6